MTIIEKIRKRWRREGVKYKKIGEDFKWQKKKRTADCAICGKHEKEKKLDRGFFNWGILIHEADKDGKAPEICPDCMRQISSNIISPPRFAECGICQIRQREKIYGVGWPGWNPTITSGRRSDTQIIRNLICPDCTLKLAIKLGDKFIRGSWTDLTYASGSLLTSTKMTQNQANFAALGETDAGAPTPFDTISAIQWGALNALVEWTDWVPNLTGNADLSGYDAARYYRIGDLCFFYFNALTKDVTTAGAYVQITLPFTSANKGNVALSRDLYDGANNLTPYGRIKGNANYFEITKTAAAGAWAGTEVGIHIIAAGFFEIA